MSAPQYRSIISEPDGTTWAVQQVEKWRGPTADHACVFVDSDGDVDLDGQTVPFIISEHNSLGSGSGDSQFRPGLGRYATIHVLIDGVGYTCTASTDERAF